MYVTYINCTFTSLCMIPKSCRNPRNNKGKREKAKRCFKSLVNCNMICASIQVNAYSKSTLYDERLLNTDPVRCPAPQQRAEPHLPQTGL